MASVRTRDLRVESVVPDAGRVLVNMANAAHTSGAQFRVRRDTIEIHDAFAGGFLPVEITHDLSRPRSRGPSMDASQAGRIFAAAARSKTGAV